jgi:hypothetical protein
MTHATDTPPQLDPLAELDAYCPECGEWITASDGYCIWHEEPVEVDVTAPWGVMPCPPKTTPSDV